VKDIYKLDNIKLPQWNKCIHLPYRLNMLNPLLNASQIDELEKGAGFPAA